uniref:Reverse transcriptase domain-containing protein n=1 Tax=Schizaphis graminum TaxID=13262 RepID=A0A2S2NGF1_SCHGA
METGIPCGLSENQFGFRSKRSTTDALAVVCKAAEDGGPRKKTGMLSLDVHNAFNSAPWDKILEAMEAKKLPTYLCQLVDNYLWDRTLYTQHQSGTEVPVQLSSGVPQGSVLGPTLWNILYDDLLRMRLPVGARYLAFTDDVAIIPQATDIIGLKNTLQTAAKTTRDWMQNIGLHLALHKTEMLVITKTRTHNELEIDIDGNVMLARKELKYLGIRLAQKVSFTAHVRTTCEKASRAVQNLSRILPNVSAAKQVKRMLMSNVVHSMLLYGAPVWATKMSKKRLSELAKVQRHIALRVASAYRITSTDAVLVITGIPRIDLQALKRKAIYDNRLRPETGEGREEAESMLNRTWQVRAATRRKADGRIRSSGTSRDGGMGGTGTQTIG